MRIVETQSRYIEKNIYFLFPGQFFLQCCPFIFMYTKGVFAHILNFFFKPGFYMINYGHAHCKGFEYIFTN